MAVHLTERGAALGRGGCKRGEFMGDVDTVGPPVDELHLGRTPTPKLIHDGAESDVKRLTRGGEVGKPVAGSKGDATNLCAMLNQ